VFLAIALGVVIGSTFIEPALVDNLRNQVDSVRGDLDKRVATIDDLNQQIAALQDYADQSVPFAVENQLVGTTSVVVAEDGVNGGDVERLVGRMRQAGAHVDGIVWVKPKVQLTDPKDADQLRGILGLSSRKRVSWNDAWSAVLTETGQVGGVKVSGSGTDGSTSTAVTTTTTTKSKAGGATTTIAPVPAPGKVFATPTLQALADAGFVRLQRIQESGKASRAAQSKELPFAVVLVTGPEAGDGAAALTEEVARQQASLDVPTVVAEIWKDTKNGPPRGAGVAPIREDGELSSRVSTVDDLDIVQGQVAVIAAMADLGRGVVGHYGYGKGAGRVLPEWLGS
jgi:hypothetical protein